MSFLYEQDRDKEVCRGICALKTGEGFGVRSSGVGPSLGGPEGRLSDHHLSVASFTSVAARMPERSAPSMVACRTDVCSPAK
jgi:hypothetical protein